MKAALTKHLETVPEDLAEAELGALTFTFKVP
jgi:hypothetical protein